MTRVLVVDDSADIRALLSIVLRGAGLEVADAPGSSEALAEVGLGGVDLIVLDIQMPGADGWETFEAVRDSGCEVPIVFCTVKSSVEDEARAWTMGADGFITKPFDLDTLADEVTRAASRSPAEREGVRALRLAALRPGA